MVKIFLPITTKTWLKISMTLARMLTLLVMTQMLISIRMSLLIIFMVLTSNFDFYLTFYISDDDMSNPYNSEKNLPSYTYSQREVSYNAS
jgi:hypothetical protein